MGFRKFLSPLSIVGVVVLMLGLGIAVVGLQQQQDNRSQAAGISETTTVYGKQSSGNVKTITGFSVGTQYKITVSGYINYEGTKDKHYDARYYFTGSGQGASNPPVTFNGGSLTPESDGYHSNHVYTFLWKADTTNMVVGAWDCDTCYNDNSGQLNITVTPVDQASSAKTCAVSDTTNTVEGGGAAVAVNPAPLQYWPASIPGATWIWSSNPVKESTTTDVSKTFVKAFKITGPVTSAKLMIAADNDYSQVSLNGTDLSFSGADSFLSAKTHTLSSSQLSILHEGINTLKITVKNRGVPNTTGTTNPAGLLYKFTADVGECDPNASAPSNGNTKFNLNLMIHGIGSGEFNVQNSQWGGKPPSSDVPDLRTRDVKVQVYEITDQGDGSKLVEATGQVKYDNAGGGYISVAPIDMGTKLQTGKYDIRIISGPALWKEPRTITGGQLNTINMVLANGDADRNEKLNILDYNLIYSCVKDEVVNKVPTLAECSDENKVKADIDDDGKVYWFDQNLLIKQFSNPIF